MADLVVNPVEEAWYHGKQGRLEFFDVIHQELDVSSEEAYLAAVEEEEGLREPTHPLTP